MMEQIDAGMQYACICWQIINFHHLQSLTFYHSLSNNADYINKSEKAEIFTPLGIPLWDLIKMRKKFCNYGVKNILQLHSNVSVNDLYFLRMLQGQ